MKPIITLTLAALFAALAINAQTPTGRDIAQRVKDRENGDDRTSEMNLTLVNKSGRTRERKVKSYAIDILKDTKQIMFFLYPGDVKGTGFLTWDYDDTNKEDDKWLYLPAMKKTRRISGASSKTDYFMGTDFTYDDMGSRSVDEDTHTLLREEDVEGHTCWVLQSVPKDTREIYSRKLTWIRQDCLIALRAEYYDKLDELHRVLTISEIRKVQGFWMFHKMHMKNVQTRHETIITVDNPTFNTGLKESAFTVSQLERGSL